MLKATISSVLALSLALSVTACNKQDPGKASSAATTAAPATAPAGAAPLQDGNHPPTKPAADVDLSGIAKAEGGKTVGEVFADRAALTGQTVAVRGKVVKVNGGIMNLDWIHVRDGSGAEGSNDLLATSTGAPLPNVGDTVLVKGKVALDKDFGMGYKYPVMLEGSTVTVEKPAVQ